MTPYEHGFIDKCAEFGVDVKEVLKAAQAPTTAPDVNISLPNIPTPAPKVAPVTSIPNIKPQRKMFSPSKGVSIADTPANRAKWAPKTNVANNTGIKGNSRMRQSGKTWTGTRATTARN